jgi:menaquinone-9 beta-reductase
MTEPTGYMTGSAAQVIVVGAGPAGSATALLLARDGFDVLLLDRSAFPRAKPCGDCLSAGASAVLRRLGVLDRIEQLPHARLRGWRIVAPDGSEFRGSFATPDSTAPASARAGPGGARAAGPGGARTGHTPGARPGTLPTHALAVERYHLDAALADAACAAGARFITGVRVLDLARARDGRVNGVVLHDNVMNDEVLHDHVLRAPLVIGADGLRSVTARVLGAVRRPPRLRKVSLTMHIDRDIVDPDIGEMHSGDGVCAGVAALRSDASRCNLTVVADADRFGRDIAGDSRAFMHRAVESLPALRGRILASDLRDGPLLASGPFDRPVSRAVFDGAALVGDAAGYFDPFTGQGVYQALAGAEILAGVAGEALRRGDTSARALMGYDARRRRLSRGPRLVQHAIEAVLARPRLASRAIARIGRARRFADTLVAVTGDTTPPHSLLAPRALLSLLLPA